MGEINFNSFMESFIAEYNKNKYYLYHNTSCIMGNDIDLTKESYPLFNIVAHDGQLGLSIKLFNNTNSLIYAMIYVTEEREWILKHIKCGGKPIKINLKSTEEEMFQRSLIETELCDYEYLKFIRRLLREVIDNINKLEGCNYVI